MSFRYGEQETVAANRAAFLGRVGIDASRVVVMDVEHGNKVVSVTAEDAGDCLSPQHRVAAEALMTNEPGLALFLLTADCLPVAFHDPAHGAIALAHLGWKPSAAGLAAKVVHEMQGAYGTDARDLHVIIGPGIHKESYAFEHLDQAASPEWQPFLSQDTKGKWHVDLAGFNVAQLVAAGVPSDAIAVDPVDTAASTQYFSHYRAARTGEPEGRFATVIRLVQ